MQSTLKFDIFTAVSDGKSTKNTTQSASHTVRSSSGLKQLKDAGPGKFFGYDQQDSQPLSCNVNLRVLLVGVVGVVAMH